MRKFWYGGAVVGLAILGAVAPLRAQTSTNAGSSGQQNNIPFGTKSGEFLLIPVGGRDLQVLRLYRRSEGGFQHEDVTPCAFVPLVGRFGWQQ